MPLTIMGKTFTTRDVKHFDKTVKKMGPKVCKIAEDVEERIYGSAGTICQTFPTCEIRLERQPSTKMNAINKPSSFFTVKRWTGKRNIHPSFYREHITCGFLRLERNDETHETCPVVVFFNDLARNFSGELCFYRTGRFGARFGKPEERALVTDCTLYLTCRIRPELGGADEDQLKTLLHIDTYKCMKKFLVIGEDLEKENLHFSDVDPCPPLSLGADAPLYAADAAFDDDEEDERAYDIVKPVRNGKFVDPEDLAEYDGTAEAVANPNESIAPTESTASITAE